MCTFMDTDTSGDNSWLPTKIIQAPLRLFPADQLQYVIRWAKTRRFHTSLKFLFIASMFCIVSKEWTAKFSASYDT